MKQKIVPLKKIIILLALILISVNSLALTSNQAKEIALTLLEKNETLELSPANSSVQAKENYFVFIVSQENQLTGFIPVESKTGLVSEISAKNKGTFEKIFKTQYFARTLQKIKISGKNYLQQADLESMKNFKQKISQQKDNLELIKADADLNSDLISLIENQQEQLNAFDESANIIISLIEELLAGQQEILESTGISYEQNLNLKNKFSLLENSVNELQEQKINYIKSREELSITLIRSGLDDGKKLSYNNMIKILGVDDIDSFKTNISLINSLVKEAFDFVIPASIYDELNQRMQKKSAYDEINAGDENFKKKTGYNSVKEAVEKIKSTNETSLFENQNQLELLETNYSKALSEFNKKNYALAKEYAGKAKQNAINVITDGFKQEEKQELELWKIGAIIAIVIIVIAVAFFLFLRKPKKEVFIEQSNQENNFEKFERP